MNTSFHPTPRTLMGPGPSDVHPRVLGAMGKATIGHLDPEFVRLMEEIKDLMRYTFRTSNPLTLPLSAPGSAAMEAAYANLLEPGDKAIICINGVFGGRMAENVVRMGGELITIDQEWGEAVCGDRLEAALKENRDTKLVGFVQAETSTGVKSDVKALCGIAREYDCLTIVDSVTGLAGIELETDDWGADVVYSGSQKCLSCPPGISLITFGEKAERKIQSRNTPVQSWFLDLNLVMTYWGKGAKRAYHHTAPVNALYALHESLLIVKEEGLEASWERHMHNHLALRAGLAEIGLNLPVNEADRLPQLNLVAIPDGIDDATLRSQLLTDFDLEIGAGLGVLAGKVWRIGLMGFSAKPENVLLCLTALERCLIAQGMSIESGTAVAAAEAVYSS